MDNIVGYQCTVMANLLGTPRSFTTSIYCPHPPLRMGAIAVSGKILCLSVTQFCVACHSATVGEIDTKPVL